MADSDSPPPVGTTVFDYIALGMILAPSAVVAEIYIRGEPIDLKRVIIANMVCIPSGVFFLWASRNWAKWQTSITPSLGNMEKHLWMRALIVILLLTIGYWGPSLISSQSGSPQVGDAVAQPTDEPLRAQLRDSQGKINSLQAQLEAKLPARITAFCAIELLDEYTAARSRLKPQRILLLMTSSDENTTLKRDLGYLLLGLPASRVGPHADNLFVEAPWPDNVKYLDAPRPTPSQRSGITIHGSGDAADLLENLLGQIGPIHVDRAFDQKPLLDYYEENHAIPLPSRELAIGPFFSSIVWLEIGPTDSSFQGGTCITH